MDADDDLVLCRVEDRVATLTLNRPERKNAWSIELEIRYFDLLDELDRDPEVRAIVLTATGPFFCPGLDVVRLADKAAGVAPPTRTRPISHPFSVRKPLIGAINGTAAGLGLAQLALCDVRFAAEGVRMTTSFARRGLVAEHLLSWLLPRIVGHGRASDLLLSGRIFDAEEALAMGFVNRVTTSGTLLADAQAYARDLADHCSPLALAQLKEQLRADWTRTASESLVASEELKVHPLRADELREGVASLVERRLPAFAALPAEVQP